MSINEVYINYWGKPKPEFTEYQLALMEGGHSIELPAKYTFLKTLAETSKNTVEGSFSKDLVKSKEWLGDELAKIKTKFGNVYVLGSWYANLSIILDKDITYHTLYNIDVNRTALEKGQALANDMGMVNVQSQHRNANDVTYNRPTLIINTSVNNIENAGWFDNIPQGTLVVLQSRNNDPQAVNQCNSVDELVEQYPLTKILFKDQLKLNDGKPYQRYMVIGVR